MSANKFLSRFGKTRVVLPVVHVLDHEQALAGTETARSAGADGVWLISHGSVSGEELTALQSAIIDETGWLNIGVNCIGMPVEAVLGIADPRGIGVWADDAGIHEEADVQRAADRVARRHPNYTGLYFGGVAFKDRAPVTDLARVARLAIPYVDVITTSGAGTGLAAPPEKIRTIREAAGDYPVAVASGITPENVHGYLPFTNAFLVATGISSDFHTLDPARTAALVKAVREYEPA